MRKKCVICGRGAEFPRASARRCLTFPRSVYSAYLFSHWSFFTPTRYTGFADSPPVDGKLLMQLLYHGELPTRLDSLHGQCDPIFPTVLGWTTLDFVELCIISSHILQGQVLCERVHPRTASFPLFTQDGARNKFLAFHWTLKWNNSITEPTTSTQAQTRSS